MAAVILTALPVASFAQYGGGPGAGGRSADEQKQAEDSAKKRERDKEWGDKGAPLPQLRNIGPCPYVKALYDAARYIEFKDAKEASADVGFTGEIQGISSGCEYKETTPIHVVMQILFELGRGPMATSSSKTFHYWVAVTDRNREVIAKQEFDLPITFPAGQDRVLKTEEINNLVIPRGTAATSGSNFEVLVGFDVTPQMADFNRLGKRFRVNAGTTTVASGTAPTPK
jgi:hypothetical protein